MARRILKYVCGALGFSACVFGLWLALGLESWPRTDPLPPPHVGIVLVLSSGVASDSLLDGAGIERLKTGIAIAEALGATLVTTRTKHGTGGPTSDYAQSLLIHAAGLGGHQWVVLDGVVHSTREEAMRARSAVASGSHIVVVTSLFHTRRACAAFEEVGFKVTCRAAMQRHRSISGLGYDYVYERFAFWKYRHNGWIR